MGNDCVKEPQEPEPHQDSHKFSGGQYSRTSSTRSGGHHGDVSTGEPPQGRQHVARSQPEVIMAPAGGHGDINTGRQVQDEPRDASSQAEVESCIRTGAQDIKLTLTAVERDEFIKDVDSFVATFPKLVKHVKKTKQETKYISFTVLTDFEKSWKKNKTNISSKWDKIKARIAGKQGQELLCDVSEHGHCRYVDSVSSTRREIVLKVVFQRNIRSHMQTSAAELWNETYFWQHWIEILNVIVDDVKEDSAWVSQKFVALWETTGHIYQILWAQGEKGNACFYEGFAEKKSQATAAGVARTSTHTFTAPETTAPMAIESKGSHDRHPPPEAPTPGTSSKTTKATPGGQDNQQHSERELKKLLETVSRLEKESEDLRERATKAEEKAEKLKGKNEKLNEENERLRTSHPGAATQGGEEVERLRREVKQLQDERAKLLDSMAAKMNEEMSRDESDLENISVRIRPMTILEDFHLFCSNEWLEAKTALDDWAEKTDKNEDEKWKCELLVDVLYKCHESAGELLVTVLKKLDGRLDEQLFACMHESLGGPSPAKTTDSLHKPNIDRGVDENLKLYAVKRLRTTSTTPSFKPFAKDTAKQFFLARLGMPVSQQITDNPDIVSYFEKSLQLCWNMVIQLPPMAFRCLPAPGGQFEERTHEAHFGSADPRKPNTEIDYYVHPALFHGKKQMRKARVMLRVREAWSEKSARSSQAYTANPNTYPDTNPRDSLTRSIGANHTAGVTGNPTGSPAANPTTSCTPAPGHSQLGGSVASPPKRPAITENPERDEANDEGKSLGKKNKKKKKKKHSSDL